MQKTDISFFCACKGFVEQPASKAKSSKICSSFSSSYLQVGECQKEGSGSGKQGSQGRGDLWVRSQGDKRRREREGTEGAREERTRLSAARLEGGKSRKQDKRKGERGKG